MPDCNYYVFDCNLSLCSLHRLGTQKTHYSQNGYYITGADAVGDDNVYDEDYNHGDKLI